jgi:hypothetical protein
MEITSNMIIKADGTTKQNIKKGTGIKTPHIQNEAVTTTKIGNKAVIESKIANGAVTESKLGDNSITSSKIKDGSVGNAEIANGAVTEKKLAENVKKKLVTKGDNHIHSATDVGALPITGGTVNGNFSVNGKVGIGTSEPGAVLDVNGDLHTTDIKINGTNQGSNYIRFGDVQLAWGLNYSQNPGGGNMLVTVNLPVPYKDNSYIEIITQVDPDATGYRKNLSVKSQSNNSFVVWSPLGQGTTYYFKWLTIGKWR